MISVVSQARPTLLPACRQSLLAEGLICDLALVSSLIMTAFIHGSILVPTCSTARPPLAAAGLKRRRQEQTKEVRFIYEFAKSCQQKRRMVKRACLLISRVVRQKICLLYSTKLYLPVLGSILPEPLFYWRDSSPALRRISVYIHSLGIPHSFTMNHTFTHEESQIHLLGSVHLSTKRHTLTYAALHIYLNFITRTSPTNQTWMQEGNNCQEVVSGSINRYRDQDHLNYP